MKFFFTGVWALIFVVNSSAQFAEKQIISPEVEPWRIVPADVDGDGDSDLIVSGYRKLTWIENIDGQGYTEHSNLILEFPNQFIDIEVVDLDQDNDLDILAYHETHLPAMYNILFLENINGLGKFENRGIVAEGGTVDDIASGDIDSDGDIDFFYFDSGASSEWFENQGDESFIERDGISSNSTALYEAFLVDLDLDGHLDVINSKGDEISWFKNEDGFGSYGSEQLLFDFGFGSHQVKVDDIDQDGDQDIVFYTSANSFGWIENVDGAANFEAHYITTDFDDVDQIEPVDVDNDGDLDIVATEDGFEDRTGWYENINNEFTVFHLIEKDWIQYNQLEAVDFDGDGDQDIFSSENHYGAKIVWYENLDGLGTFSLEIPIIHHLISSSCEALDIDNDGDLDLASGSGWYENLDGYGDFSNQKLVSRFGVSAVYNDLDGDGDLDLLTYDSVGFGLNSMIVWYQNNGTGVFTNKTVINDDLTYSPILKSFDVDGDNDEDILFRTNAPFATTYWCENINGLGLFSEAIAIPSPEYISEPLYACDLDNDNLKDLIYFDGYDLLFYKNLGGGSFAESESIVSNYDFDFYDLIDLDLDGDIDIVGRIDDAIRWLENEDGFGLFNEPVELISDIPTSDINDEIYGTDLDSDGDIDLVHLTSNGSDYHWSERDENGEYLVSHSLGFDPINSTNHLVFADIGNDSDIDVFFNGYNGYEICWFENYSQNPRIEGIVFWDQNENGIKDTLEVGLYQQGINVLPNVVFTESTLAGEYSFAVNAGNYELICEPSTGWDFSTDSLFNITVPNANEIIEQDIGLIVVDSSAQISVDIASAPTRCGFEVPFWLNYQNTGGLIIDGFVHLELDSLVSVLSMEPFADSINLDTNGVLHLIWDFEELYPTYSECLKLNLQMPGVDFLDSLIYLQSNISTLDTLGEVVFSDTTFYSSQIQCAYDPNDKLVEPNFPDYDNYTLFGDTLIYTIRFQNVGSDTAFNIFIEDDLDPFLDWSTFEVVSASHDYSYSLYENGRVVFDFPDILLPHEGVNEFESHGFVKYKILPKEGLDEYTVIVNDAEIYFDFNPPIYTNIVSSILVSEIPFPFTLDEPNCNGELGSITVLPILPNMEYSWSTGDEGTMLNNVPAGSYGLNITNSSGQIFSDTLIVLSQPEILELNGFSTPSNGSTIYGTASVSPYGGSGPYEYTWNTDPIQHSSIATGLLPGVYDVTVVDENGCQITSAVTVDLNFELDLNIQHPLCFGSEDGTIAVNTFIDNLSYSWTNGALVDSVSNLPAGTIQLIVEDSYGNTLADSLIELIAPEQIVIDISSTVSDGSSVYGTATVLPAGGTPDFTYEWNTNPSQNAQVATGLIPGVYTVLVTDANGCVEMSEVDVGLDFDFSAIQQDPLCFESTNGFIEVITILDSLTFVWNEISGNSLHENIGAGNYSLELIYNDDEILVDTIFILESPPLIVLDFDVEDADNFDLTNGSAKVLPSVGVYPFSYLWDTDPSITNSTAGGLSPGTYTVTVTDANNCEMVGEVVVGPYVQTFDFAKEIAFEVYPNPTTGIVWVDIIGESTLTDGLTISNAIGSVVKKLNAEIFYESKPIPINLPSGLYYFSLEVDSERITKKIIILP